MGAEDIVLNPGELAATFIGPFEIAMWHVRLGGTIFRPEWPAGEWVFGRFDDTGDLDGFTRITAGGVDETWCPNVDDLLSHDWAAPLSEEVNDQVWQLEEED